jgi:hypothetical protein
VSFFEKVPNTMYTSLSASHYFWFSFEILNNSMQHSCRNLTPTTPNFSVDIERESKNVSIKLLTPDPLLIQRVSVQGPQTSLHYTPFWFLIIDFDTLDMATYTKQVITTVREYLAANKPLFQNLKELFLVRHFSLCIFRWLFWYYTVCYFVSFIFEMVLWYKLCS